MTLRAAVNPKNQIPFALCGSSESGRTDPVVVNTYSASVCECGVRLFSLNLSASSNGMESFATATALELDDPLQGVREVVSAIKQARPLPTTQSFDELLRRASAERGTPEDIESWASSLARKTGDLND